MPQFDLASSLTRKAIVLKAAAFRTVTHVDASFGELPQTTMFIKDIMDSLSKTKVKSDEELTLVDAATWDYEDEVVVRRPPSAVSRAPRIVRP